MMRPSVRAFLTILITMSALLAANIRDSNAYLVLTITLLLAVSALIQRRAWRPIVTIIIVGVMSAGIAMTTANIGQRWRIPMGDLFTGRIIETPMILDYFIHAGMPTDQLHAIEHHAQHIPLGIVRDVYGQQLVAANTPLGDWFATHSKSTYERFLLSHPGYSLSPLINSQYWMTLLISSVNFAMYLTYNTPALYQQYQHHLQQHTAFYQSNHSVVDAWPISLVLKWLYNGSSLFDAIILFLALYRLICHYRHLPPPGLCFCTLGCLAAIVPLGLIVWLAEPMEVFRHQLGNHITLILLSCYIIALPSHVKRGNEK